MAGVHRTQVCKIAHTVYGCPGSGSRADQNSAEIAWRASWKKRSWHSTKGSTGFPELRRGGLSEAQVLLPEPVSPETSSPSHHPTSSLPLPAAACGQEHCSTRLCSTPGRPPPPPSPPAVTTHRSSLQGVGTPELDTSHLSPTAQPAGQTHGQTQDPGALKWAARQGPSQPLQGQCKLGVQPFWSP